jgi:D-beta-D-heptose 7-phosphate kinase / D-beta-D-heptose 1-phosphate adenosyltransferase
MWMVAAVTQQHGRLMSDILTLNGAKVFVFGDLILDSYLTGQVTRISPEAPVPVLLEKNRWQVLGGAANVAANVASFGAKAHICGVIGADTAGKDFKELCQPLGIDVEAILEVPSRPTTRKLRVMAGYQQIVRVDSEVESHVSLGQVTFFTEAFKKFIGQDPTKKVLVVSDYGKGVCTVEALEQLIGIACHHNIPIVTDPKSLDLNRYRRSTVLKPNLTEGRNILKATRPGFIPSDFNQEVAAICETVLEKSGARNIVLSLSEKGVRVQGQDVKSPRHFASSALQVADVSGAGDTMLAFLAMGLASGLPMDRSVQLANVASGLVCQKLGTATLTSGEMIDAVRHESKNESTEKVLDADNLKSILSKARHQKQKVVFTNGCFDLLHAGHIEILERSKAFGDVLVVGLNADASVKRLKGPTRPVQSEADRARILSALKSVDYVTVFTEDTPLELIKKLQPDILVKGGDYNASTIVGAKEVTDRGGRVEIVDLVPGRSTSSIIEKSKT